MNIWRFAGFAFSQSQHSPHPLAHSPSAAEPALATWPQLKMRKVDEKSKKFSVSPLSPSVSLSFLFPANNETKWDFQLSCQQHTPLKDGRPLEWAILLSRRCQCSCVWQTHSNWNVAPASAPAARGAAELGRGGGEIHSRHI